MKVEVRLFAALREGRFRKRLLDVPDDTALAGLLERFGLSAERIGLRLVNGRWSDFDTVLADGDVVSLFPGVGGG
jgi:molybdopterin converting factor small subunit